MQFVNFKAKTVQDAIMEASIHFGVASDEIEYEVVQNESKGLFGIFNTKEAIIKARVGGNAADAAKDFLKEVFDAMNMVVAIDTKYDEENRNLTIDLCGDEWIVYLKEEKK